MKDTLREECDDGVDCLRNCCVSGYFAPLFFVVFVLMAQFVLVNVVVAVLMKHLEESHKQVIIIMPGISIIIYYYMCIRGCRFCFVYTTKAVMYKFSIKYSKNYI